MFAPDVLPIQITFGLYLVLLILWIAFATSKIITNRLKIASLIVLFVMFLPSFCIIGALVDSQRYGIFHFNSPCH